MSFPPGVLVNRRRDERIPLRCPVEVEGTAYGTLRGMVLNLSSHGALIALPCLVPLGAEWRIKLFLPDNPQPLELAAIGLRIETGPNSAPPAKVGLNFIMPTAEQIQRIRELIYVE
jgi:hypothetical protein